MNNLKVKVFKTTAVFLSISILFQVVFPTVSYALTSGPSQPEVQSFEPVGTTEMVDLFTGDFTYNIPLFELPGPNGGYPFNMHYNSGVSMDQEASWVGLGWNLNPGSINRQMRGLPDEYDGTDMVHNVQSIKPNVTYGVGFGGGAEFAGADITVGLGINLGMSIYYNNYKGVGYSIDQGISVTAKSADSGPSAGIGLNLSADSQEGVGANASLSLSDRSDNNKKNFDVGIGFNSRSGAHVSMGFTIAAKNKDTKTSRKQNSAKKKKNGDSGKSGGAATAGAVAGATANSKSTGFGQPMGGTATLSFTSIGYSPSLSMPMTGRNITLQFKIGGQLAIAYLSGYINGFYNTQYYAYDNQDIATPAYGYLNLHNAPADDNVMMDFNREKDGMVRKTTPNLAIPSLTFDIYSVTGQGIAGMCRAFRNDIGAVYDPHTESESFGGSLGLEIGIGNLIEIGADIGANYSSSKSGALSGGYQFVGSDPDNPLYEPAYFKTYGEHTTDDKDELNYIGGEKAVRIKLDYMDIASNKQIEDNARNPYDVKNLNPVTEKREPRNVVINYVNNDPKNNMVAVNPDGTRYFYRKALNNQQIECSYACGPLQTIRGLFPSTTIDDCGPVIPIKTDAPGSNVPEHDFENTNEYYKRTTMPAYAYSYLIDYVLGVDYVDADNVAGPSDGDLGYWVKFNYGTATSYNWRVPFYGANYLKGLYTTFEDDKGSYTYGTKDIYYLSSVETKSHKADFVSSDRLDAKGAYSEIQNNDGTTIGASSKKLDRIVLYSKSDPAKVPIKSVYFEYSYDLCKGVYNNASGTLTDNGSVRSSTATDFAGSISNAGGKLTLKKVWFTYGNNKRGSLSPYEFSYNETNAAENPNYNPVAYDRWGNYKPITGDVCGAMEASYVSQFDISLTKEAHRQAADVNMAVWSLKAITLPSGGKISVEYEADDYAYVQNKRATQMFQIQSVSKFYGPENDIIDHNLGDSISKRRVYFNLETPVSNKGSLATYFEGMDKLYFRVFMKVRGMGDDRQDYISGYVGKEDYDVDSSSLNSSGKYTRAFVALSEPTIGADPVHYHPFSVAAWQYIRTDQPQLSGIGPFDSDPNSNSSAAMDKVKSLVGVIPEAMQTLVGFKSYAFSQGWGKKVILNKSYIRLNSPDKQKLGGGVRVKKIVLDDDWTVSTASGTSGENKSYYGQVYDYTMVEDGATITSGVASYEPFIGGDENPLRTAKQYVESIPLKTDNNLFFEYPINEGYYPGANVGYRKVTVKSLATAYENQPGNAYNIQSGILTTGATVHEFFTSKEFPVITEETIINLNVDNWFIPIPLIGQLSSNKLTASQGYATSLNDMHGKLKKITNYKQDINGNILTPESYVEYLYNYQTIKTDGNANNDYYVLNNEFPVLAGDFNGTADRRDGTNGTSKRLIGQDYEFFTDMRYAHSVTESAGLKINFDEFLLAIIPLGFPAPWPALSRSTTEMKLAVTNKIIHKSGIMTGTKAYDGESIVTTENVLFDNLTGQAILTRVSNDFDDPIYDYDIPGYFAFDGMGPSYLNTGMSIDLSLDYNGQALSFPAAINYLVPGDELILSTNAAYRIVLASKVNGIYLFKLNTNTQNDAIGSSVSGKFYVARSGRRNILDAMMGNIKTLGDKTDLKIGDPTLNSNRY